MSKSKKKSSKYKLCHISLSKKAAPDVCHICWRVHRKLVPVDCYMQNIDYPDDPPAATWYGCSKCIRKLMDKYNELEDKYNEVQALEFGDD